MNVPHRPAPCADHPERASVGLCSRCARPLCAECAHESVSTERVFCSERCAGASRRVEGEEAAVDNERLRAGLERPIRAGWWLWARSLGEVAAAALPVAALLGPVLWFYLEVGAPDPQAAAAGAVNGIGFAALVVVAAYGVAVVGLVLSRRHTGLVRGNVFARAAVRFLPWVTTWVLMFAITTVGYLAFVVPGIYLALRLFWADELALVHGMSPFAALRASWRLTDEAAASLFRFQLVVGFAQYLVLVPAAVLLVAIFTGWSRTGWREPGVVTPADGLLIGFVGLIAYGAMHAPELVQFYGMRAERALTGESERE